MSTPITAGERRRWAAMSSPERHLRVLIDRYSTDTRWERLADPGGVLNPGDRAIAGSRLRDQHYAEQLGQGIRASRTHEDGADVDLRALISGLRASIGSRLLSRAIAAMPCPCTEDESCELHHLLGESVA